MSVISRSALESSSLADLHEIASELGLDGFRRLRKADLVAAITDRQGADGADDAAAVSDEADAPSDGAGADADAGGDDEDRPARRSRRGGRGRGRSRDRDPRAADADGDEEAAASQPSSRSRRPRGADADGDEEAAAPQRSSRPRRPRGDGDDGGRDRQRERSDGDDRITSGTVELLPNGSGFVRVSPPEPSDDDVYVSAAQVRRCELVAGDEVSGPVRAPRRSERYPSLIRIDTINGRAADEVAEGTKYEELPCAYASARFALDADDDPTLKAIEWLTPIGRGSRVALVGASRAGKTEALRRIAVALRRQDELEVSVLLAGVRPEELADWKGAEVEPVGALTLGTAADAQAQAIERAVETGRRVAARGGHAVLLIDTLEQVPGAVARRALAAARNIVDGGSLTIVATAPAPLGGETTVIAFDAELAGSGRLPALDLAASGTVRAELLVGDKGAEAIAQARAAAIAGA